MESEKEKSNRVDRRHAIYWILPVLFILMIGNSLNTVRISRVVDRTDATVQRVAGPKAQAAQAESQVKVIAELLARMNCIDQRNLQTMIDTLIPDNEKSILDQECQQPKEVPNE